MKQQLNFLTLIGFILLTASYSSAQNLSYAWGNTIPVGDGDNYSIAVDSSGNSYELGRFSGGGSGTNYDFDPGPGVFNVVGTNTGTYKMFIRKLDPNGNFLWVKTIQNSNINPWRIIVDKNQDVVIIGNFNGSMNFNPAGGSDFLSTVGSKDNVFILKLDSDGLFQWVKQLRTISTSDKVIVAFRGGLSITSNNDIVVSGNFDGKVDFDPSTTTTYNINTLSASNLGFIVKLTENGDFIWATQMGTSPNSVNFSGHVQDNNEDLICAVTHDANSDLDPGPGVISFPTYGLALLKFDQTGSIVWGEQVGRYTSLTDLPVLATNQFNDIFLAASFDGTAYVAGIDTLNAYGISEDAFLTKFSPAGVYQWTHQLKGSGSGTSSTLIDAIGIDSLNTIYITGNVNDSVYVDQNNNANAVVDNGGVDDKYIATYNSNGDYLNQYLFRNSGSGNNFEFGQFFHTASSLYGIGYISGGWDGDPGAGTEILSGSLSGRPMVIKFDQCANSSTSVVSNCGPYTTGGQTYTTSGIYTQTLQNVNGCDSLVTLDLTITSPSTGTDTQTACDSYTWIDGITYTSSNNTATFTLPNAAGCDSVITLDLTINQSTSGTDMQTACSSFTWIDGNTYTSSNNTATHILPNSVGCDSVVTLDLTIGDALAPVADLMMLPNVNSECSVASLTPPTATDNCAGSISATTSTTFPITSQGTTTVTWTYDDGNGNTSTQTQDVIINDVTAPVADLTTLPTISSDCSVASVPAPSSTDNCGGTILGTTNATFPIAAQGTTTITWTFDDGNGNTSTQTQDVVINDATAPVADLASLADITAECSVTSLTPPTATDNCSGSVSGTHNASLPITAQGTTTITWTYDDGNGNTSTQTQDVVINDVTAPVADLANLPNITSECSVTTLTPPTATDNCAGSVSGTHNASLPITTSGTTTVTWTFDDGNGNTTTQSQDIVINDVTAPSADLANLPNITAQCSVTSLTPPTATDNCAGSITGTHNASLPITTQGTTTITWTYTDGNGNTTTQSQDIVINDVTAPIADLANLPQIDSDCEVTPTPPTGTDNCAGVISATPDVSFPITASGTTTITWTYDDGNGNTTSQIQNVVITPIDNGITQVDPFTLSADATGYSYQWVDCDNGNAPIAGANTQSFTPSVGGSYACEVSSATCTVTTACLTSSVGINEHSFSHSIVVYPNPSEGIIFVDFGEGHTGVVTELLDMTGRVIEQKEFSTSENVELFFEGPSGVYFLNIENTEGQKAVFMIEKV